MPLPRRALRWACTAFLVGGVVVGAHALPPQETIAPSVAGLYVGERRSVEGRVTSIDRDANVVNLHFGDSRATLTISLVIGILSGFPPEPDTYYANHIVRAVGVIERFRDTLGMTIRDPDDITVVDIEAPAAGGAGQPAVDIQERYDEMNSRLRDLERRLNQIDSPAATPPRPNTTEHSHE